MWTTRWPELPGVPTELSRLRDEIDRAFGSRRGNGGARRTVAYPALNVFDDDDNLYVEAEVPGMERDDFVIFVNGDDQLTIQGERKQPANDNGTWHRQERGYGKFSRLIQLPSDVDGENVSATYEAGVLLITMPKKDEAKPRRIEVKAPK